MKLGMNLETAKPEDAQALARFFKRFPSQGAVELLVDRSKDYYGPGRIQSDQHLTYVLREDRENEIVGVASFAINEVLVNGKKSRVAFGRDLRILQTRQAILGWTQHFLPVMEEIRQVCKVDHFVSVMNLYDPKVVNTFIRPRPGKRPLPHYFLHRRFNLVSLHGRFPWADQPLKSIRVRRGSAHIKDALFHYIARKSAERDFLVTITPEEVSNQLARWEGLKLEDFLLALDSYDNIVGCCAPWSASGIEEYIPLRYHLDRP